MRILLTGGGTGGHLFPLIAVARKLKKISKDAQSEFAEELEFVFVGPDGFSKDAFQKEGIEAKVIFAAKMRRYFSFASILDFVTFPLGLLQAYIHVFFFMPDVIFAKGGYGSAPVAFWGILFRIPLVIHESDAVPGLANRILGKFAKKVLVSFDATSRFSANHKTIVVGNPIREELFLRAPQNAREILYIRSRKPIVFVLGGSQGSTRINNMMLLAISDFVKRYEIIHQCGEKNYETMHKAAVLEIKDREARALYHLYGTLSEKEMASAYAVCDIVVSRAGSGAVFEIAAAGKPSILIPYFPAAAAHQKTNADIYATSGAAVVLEGENLIPHLLIGEVDEILGNPERLQSMSEAARRFARPDAARRVAEELLKFA